MKKTQKILMTEFLVMLAVALIMVVLFETEYLPTGVLEENKSSEFLAVSVMEFLTICLIPLSLRLFKFGKINKDLICDVDAAHHKMLKWGTVRLLMLGVPMIVNALLYYLYMSVALGYMGIIGFLCMFFVLPTMQRCIAESRDDNTEK